MNLPWVPGFTGRAVQLTNVASTPGGVGHPQNTGGSAVSIFSIDAAGNRFNVVNLDPGQGFDWYYPREGAVAIAVANIEVDPGYPPARFTYDMPIA